MLEKKTTEEIFNLFPKICYAGVDSIEAPIKDLRICIDFKNKVWISQESLKQLIIDLDPKHKSVDLARLYARIIRT